MKPGASYNSKKCFYCDKDHEDEEKNKKCCKKIFDNQGARR